MPSRSRFYDHEFTPSVLNVLKQRDLIGGANRASLIPPVYNLHTLVEGMDKKFQEERVRNPLLETTPPEAWVAGEIVPMIQEVRSNADVEEHILVVAVCRYLTAGTAPPTPDSGQQHLHTTIEPFIPKVKKLLLAVADRRRRLREILHLGLDVYTIREARRRPEPHSRVQAVFALGIRESWSNQRIARELDCNGARPRDKDFRSYAEMLRMNPQLFYASKSSIKKKFEL